MKIDALVQKINELKNEVQQHTHTYLMDSDCTSVIDNQLNGYLKAIKTYCATNNLAKYVKELEEILPIEHNAIEFFCFWDGIVEHLLNAQILSGTQRLELINSISLKLQNKMTKHDIITYLYGFGIVAKENDNISKRIFVENILKDVDSLIIIAISKDLNLFCQDIIKTEIEDKLSKDFVKQQIQKCLAKMNGNDFDGAITNSRTLIEEILLSIEEQVTGMRLHYDGKLETLYKRVAKQINMYPDEKSIENNINQILRGIISIISGLSGISNSIADRHATTKHPCKHHAKLTVNTALILCEFLLESFEYQNNRQS